LSTSRETSTRVQQTDVPAHVAIIMDGNGRWATNQGRTRAEGHRAGTNNIRSIIKAFVNHGVEHLTLFAFSTENWDRPGDEVQTLISIIQEAILKESADLHKEGVRIQHLGRLDRLSPGLQQAMQDSVEMTRNNKRLTLNVAFDYGGRAEITSAVQAIVRDGVKAEDITEELFSTYLLTDGIPDPDLIIRTAGEMRLSNFLIWQTAYAEYYSTPVYWPDFDEVEIANAIDAYKQRKRKFGKVL